MWGKFTHIDISLWTIWELGLGCTTEFSHAGEIHLHDMMFLYVFSHKKMILKYKFLSIHFIFPKKKPLCGLIFPPLFIFILIVLKYGSLMNLKLAFRIYFLMMLLCFQTIFRQCAASMIYTAMFVSQMCGLQNSFEGFIDNRTAANVFVK